ncbi:fucose isomerase [Microbacterium sp. LjRoot45]|uniref:fucose isomerase n=1 Tax=Microbacterium sp. LjRoot45 TaxID=3342329 RepID=UPI003ECC7055
MTATITREGRTAYLVASGDLRESANREGWPTQQAMEAALSRTFEAEGWSLVRAHEFDPVKGHGFLDSQRRGMDAFLGIPQDAPVVVAETIWQYSHHVLPGLRFHRGPILTVANFSGEWPGLVGMLGLNAGLRKAGVAYSTLWSEGFDDEWFLDGLRTWMSTGRVHPDESHVRPLTAIPEGPERELGRRLADDLRRRKAIVGVFDEGCMGMYNAIIDDELLNPLGIFKERLSQSALYAEMRETSDADADAVRAWLEDAGMRFLTGDDEATELTDAQIHQQLKMYIAALRIADDFGLDAVGIQYQQGLKDLVPASDLAEGLLNDPHRPPVRSRDGSRVLWEGRMLPHFNEVDEGVAVDALLTERVWTELGFDPANTLHDIRWGEQYGDDFVWVFEISGAVPPAHLVDGYAGAVSERQRPSYFPLGGGTIKGISKPGEIVWSRVYVEAGEVRVDLGRATVVELPREETERRWAATTSQWPIMHAVLHGVTRDQMMGRHPANHVQVAYAPDAEGADRALIAKAALFAELGVPVFLCGDTPL